MSHRLQAALLAVPFLLAPRIGVADEHVLTLDRALALARERAPKILSARARVDEARGRLVGASVLLRENPVLEGGVGPRDSASDDSLDREVSVRQTFEPIGRRGSRVAGARSGVTVALAKIDEAMRQTLRDVAVAFLRILHADEQVRLEQGAETLASEVARIAERRHAAGDVAILDVNVSRAALARARSDVHDAAATGETRRGRLRVLLGMDAAVSIIAKGDLRERRPHALDDLLTTTRVRADLRELEAEVEQAEAENDAARGLRWPDVGLGARYKHEEGADVVLGEVSLPLPIFERGQGTRAEAQAQLTRLRGELEAARAAAEAEVESAFESYRLHAEAVSELERNAIPVLEENERLSQRSYETGELKLAELLAIRREVIEVRRAYLDRLLEAAVASVELERSAGALR